MKPILLLTAFTALLQLTAEAQSDSIKNVKLYRVWAETIDGKKEKGVLYKVNEVNMELLLLVFKYRPIAGPRAIKD